MIVSGEESNREKLALGDAGGRWESMSLRKHGWVRAFSMVEWVAGHPRRYWTAAVLITAPWFRL